MSSKPMVFAGGGLGDVARRLYQTTSYELLESLEETISVVCCSHNPGALEFFRFHPNSHRMVLIDVGHIYMRIVQDKEVPRSEIRDRLLATSGLEDLRDIASRREPRPIRSFYAPDRVATAGEYVVIHPFARGWGDWPKHVCDAVGRAIQRHPGATAFYVLGCDYISNDGLKKRENFSCADPRVKVLKNLSAPASFSLVANASRFVGTMSSLAQVAAFEQVPSLILHPARCKPFRPPYADYATTIWNANGVSLAYDAVFPEQLDLALSLLLERIETRPRLRELYGEVAPVPTF